MNPKEDRARYDADNRRLVAAAAEVAYDAGAPTHNCGGTILGTIEHIYCDRCDAFVHADDGHIYPLNMPTGTHQGRNQDASDSRETRSPDADADAEAAWDAASEDEGKS